MERVPPLNGKRFIALRGLAADQRRVDEALRFRLVLLAAGCTCRRAEKQYNLAMSQTDVPRRAFLRGVTAATALSYSRVFGANDRE